jgi:isoleucyl-tRNA synthetase
VHNELIYTVLDVKTKDSVNETYVVAKDLVESVLTKLDAVEHKSLGEINGADLVGATYKHVLNGETMPIIAAQHVTAESGTGLVHTAPGHGMEDYEACRALRIMPFSPVNGEGYFTAEAGKHLQGLFAFDEGNSAVIDYLKQTKGLVKEEPYKHKYPYDWRTKKPVMLRATAQWFANVEDLQQEAVQALRDVQMVPSVCMCSSSLRNVLLSLLTSFFNFDNQPSAA